MNFNLKNQRKPWAQYPRTDMTITRERETEQESRRKLTGSTKPARLASSASEIKRSTNEAAAAEALPISPRHSAQEGGRLGAARRETEGRDWPVCRYRNYYWAGPLLTGHEAQTAGPICSGGPSSPNAPVSVSATRVYRERDWGRRHERLSGETGTTKYVENPATRQFADSIMLYHISGRRNRCPVRNFTHPFHIYLYLVQTARVLQIQYRIPLKTTNPVRWNKVLEILFF